MMTHIAPTFEQPRPDSERSIDIDNLNLWHDGTLRCSSCVTLVKRLAEIGDQYLEDELDDVPGHMDRKKASRFPNRNRRYQPDALCTMCKRHIGSGQYHKQSDHLLEAHETIGEEDKTPTDGCCWFCLLVLQFKCKNGNFYSADTLSTVHYQPPLSLGLSWFWNLHLFSRSVDEPVRIDRYLPQGLQRREMDSIRIVPWRSVYWPMIKSWLRTCEDDHEECRHSSLLRHPFINDKDLTFIDVHHQNLSLGKQGSRYIALSYVWGGVPQLLLKRSNGEALLQEGALKQLEKEIPQVIRDSMEVVKALGERFLWVDSLCIVQDDDSMKDEAISEMAAIYSRALVTIIAVNGNNANSGLAGVRENSREPQDMVNIPGTGISITYWTPLDIAIDSSIYNTRGWTFQERLLSKRCLYFTETQVFLECQKQIHSEDRTGRHEGPYSRGNRTPQSGNIIVRMLSELEASENDYQIQMLRYSKLVEPYCQREFTFPNDILKAFAGIEATLEEDLLGWKMIYGLPLQLLDYALLWEPGRPRTEHDSTNVGRYSSAKVKGVTPNIVTPLQVRGSMFPSWSWAAWQGDICYAEMSSADLQVLHSPFKLAYHELHTFQTLLNKQSKPYVLSFSSECLPGSKILLRNTKIRDRHICLIRNLHGNDVGTIPGVQETFAEEYESTSVDMILLSASKLALHRFRSLEDMGYPSVFDIRYPRDEWSIYTIMFVKWENGYAKRLALGYIHRDAWKETSPEIKDILLA